MLLKELKSMLSDIKVIIYLEIAEPTLFEMCDNAEYYNEFGQELYKTFGDWEIEQIYSDYEATNIDLKVI